MYRLLFTAALLCVSFAIKAQQKQGKVIYERTAQMRMQVMGSQQGDQVQSRTDKFELLFGNNQSLWKQQERENEEPDMAGGEGVQVRMVIMGSDDVLYYNFSDATRSELRVMMDKKFIVDDSIRSLKWKMGEDTKTILNRLCRKATASTIVPRMITSIENGVMQRKEVQDTVNITAWFTQEIPVPAGPAEYQGQLPGLILALDINNGRQVYRAIDIQDKADLAAIKAPAGKKRLTPAEYRAARDKTLQEFQQNNSQGNRQIRIN